MPINEWWNFFYLCGSASITLTGLTFIAISLGVTLIKEDSLDKVNVFMSPICFHFLHVFFLCCLTAIPGVNAEWLGAAAILSALWRLWKMPNNYKVIHALAKTPEGNIDRSDWITIIIFPTIVYVGLIATGVGFLLGKAWAVEGLALCCLVLLLGAAKGAWDTVVWIAATLR